MSLVFLFDASLLLLPVDEKTDKKHLIYQIKLKMTSDIFMVKQINHIFPKYKYGRQMDMRQTFKDTCAVQAQTSFITLNSRPLRTCRVKRRKSTCWPKRKPSCRCTLKMYVHIFQIEHIVHTICTTQMVFFQYLFCNFWNLQCVIAQCAFKLKCRTVLSNSSQTCSPGCNVGCRVLFHDVKLVNVFECFESLSYCRMKAWPTTLAFKLLKFQQLVYNFERLSFVLDGKL